MAETVAATVEPAICPLSVIVVGAGIGGLVVAHRLSLAGHRVTLLEKSSALDELGAGLQLSPNATRLLQRWGMKDELEKLAVQPKNMVFRRCTFIFACLLAGLRLLHSQRRKQAWCHADSINCRHERGCLV